MLRLTIDNFKSKSQSLLLDLPQNIGIINNTELELIDNTLKQKTPQTIDYEKQRFSPNPQVTRIEYRLFNNNGMPLTYGDIGFTDDDVAFRRNNFKRSYISIEYYDSLEQSRKSFVTSQQIPVQLNSNHLSPNGQILPVFQMPMVFFIQRPPRIQFNSQGFYLFLNKSIPNNTNLYAQFTFNNAKTGNRIPLIAYNGVVSADSYVKYGNVRYFIGNFDDNTIYSVDDSDRTIQNNLSNIKIDLYKFAI